MEFTDLAIEAVVVALSALAGSAFMWMTIGPWVARKGMRDFTMEAYDLDEEDVSDPKRMMKAITKEQGKIVAQSIYGALGNIVQGAPTEELMQMGCIFWPCPDDSCPQTHGVGHRRFTGTDAAADAMDAMITV